MATQKAATTRPRGRGTTPDLSDAELERLIESEGKKHGPPCFYRLLADGPRALYDRLAARPEVRHSTIVRVVGSIYPKAGVTYHRVRHHRNTECGCEAVTS